jgi:ABC-type polar amino acid transport system ATPase subunit
MRTWFNCDCCSRTLALLRRLAAELLQTRERRPVTSVVVTHEMKTVRRIADRVVMLFPLAQLGKDKGK